MKKFFHIILVYALIFTILACGMDYLISYRLRLTNNCVLYKSWNDIYNRDFQANVVISGSSRALVQYNPLILDSVLHINSYNLGFNGSCIDRQMIKYDIFCKIHGRPDYIIQNIDFGTMDIRNGYDREQFFPYFFYDREMMKSFDQYENFNLLEKYLPIYRYVGYSPIIKTALNLTDIYNYNDSDVWIKGYVGHKKIWDGSLFAKQHTLLYAQDKQIIKKFESFLDFVTYTGTKVVFVYAPMYIGATEKIDNIKGMYEMYDSIAKKRNIPILDYNYDKMCYDTTYFYNAMHLNYKGSVLFSTKLANDLDSLAIIKRNK